MQSSALSLARLKHGVFPEEDKPKRRKEDNAGSATIDDKTFVRKMGCLDAIFHIAMGAHVIIKMLVLSFKVSDNKTGVCSLEYDLSLINDLALSFPTLARVYKVCELPLLFLRSIKSLLGFV